MPDSVTRPSETTSRQKVAHGRISEPVLVKGRRSFLPVPRPGVADAERRRHARPGDEFEPGHEPPTGWHYHECDGQFVYVLKGWVDLQFEDGRTIRIEEGDSLFIPGFLRHNETRTSETLEILEVSVPGQMGTTPCDPPEGFKAQG
jgi:mannose-6-phosphate isomerase-like protein (cupin superfamily)